MSKRLLFLISILLFGLFVYFSYLVAKERFSQYDFDTTVRMQDHISRRWDLPFSLFSVLGSAEVTSLIWLGFFIFSLLKRYWLTLLTLPLFFLSVAVEIFGKLFVHHPGPPFLFYRGVLDLTLPSHYVHTDYSYPSGHLTRTAFLITFIVLFIYYKFPNITKPLLLLGAVIFSILMFTSRIYLGEHWFSDVVGGAILGTSLGIIPGVCLPLRKRVAEIKHLP